MITEEIVESVREYATSYREHVWKDHQAHDAPMVLSVSLKDGTSIPFGGCEGDLISRYESVPVATRIRQVCATMPDEYVGQVASLILVTDGYTREVESGGVGERGELQEDFATNPATEVKQVINAAIAMDDLCGGADMHIIGLTYWFDDGGVLTWGDRIDISSDDDDVDISGAIPEALTAFFQKEAKS